MTAPKFPIEEYKKRLGEKTDCWVFPKGKETFAVNIYENGFVLRKRKETIVLDLWDLLTLKDLINKFDKKKAILKAL